MARPDLVLLDLMLPKLGGLEVLKTIRAESRTPVIMLTARTEEFDTVLGLELGADDYVTKPFRPREVMARVKANLRRVAPHPPTLAPHLTREPHRALRHGPLVLDPGKFTALANGKPLDLTPTEFRLLGCLMRQPGRVYSRSELLGAALPESDALERTVDAHLTRVRRKLEQRGVRGAVTNIRGVGYRLEEAL